MKLPQLRKQRTSKNYHGITIYDDYAWVDQLNILEVLKDSSKLLPEVKKYLEEFKKVIQFSFKLSIVEISKIFFSRLSLSIILISL